MPFCVRCSAGYGWQTEGDGLFMYDAKTKELKNYRYESEQSGLNSNYVRSLELDTENRLWVGTYSGLNIYKEATDNFSYKKFRDTGRKSVTKILSEVFLKILKAACG